MRLTRLVLVFLVLTWPGLVHPQLIVYDPTNFTVNATSAAEAVFQSAEWVIDLLPLGDWPFYGAVDDLLELQRLAAEAQQIYFDLLSIQAQLNSLYNLNTAPFTSFEMRERMAEIRQNQYLVYSYAARTQTLILTLTRTVEHIFAFIDTVAGLLGKLSATQMLSQQLGKMHQLQGEMALQQAAFQRADTLNQLAPLVAEQSLKNINDEMMLDHPRW